MPISQRTKGPDQKSDQNKADQKYVHKAPIAFGNRAPTTWWFFFGHGTKTGGMTGIPPWQAKR
jgi:hypothetical protein